MAPEIELLSLILLIATLRISSAAAAVSALSIDVNYGAYADNLPPPSQVAAFLKSRTFIDYVKLFDCNPDFIRSFAGTGISLAVTAPNGDIPALSKLPGARAWVQSNLLPFLPASNITLVFVGNEIMATTDRNLIADLVPAMRSLHAALAEAGLTRIRVSTPHSLSILSASEPPSSGRFRRGYDQIFTSEGGIMGIWDAVSSTADALRNRLSDPESVKNAYLAVADKLPRGAPDLRTPIAGILSSSYNHGRSALSTVGKAARAERVKESMPDKEALAKIGWSLTDISLDKYTRIYTVSSEGGIMGIWNVVSSTADALRNRLPDPAPVKDAYSAVADKLTRGAPNLRTPIAGILSSSYDHGRSALSTVGKAVQAERVKESMPDKEALAKIGWSLADIALEKYTRIYTGGLPVYKIIKHVVSGENDPKAAHNVKADELQELRDRMERLEALSLAQGLQLPASPQCRVVGLHEKLEDVIRIFMMKGGDFLHEQVVLQHEKWRRDALVCSLPATNKLAGDDGAQLVYGTLLVITN